MFLANVRYGLQKYTVEILRRNYGWEEFLEYIQYLDNKEPRVDSGVAHSATKAITVGVSSREDTEEPEDCLSKLESIVMKLSQNMKMFLSQGTSVKQPSSLKNMRFYGSSGGWNCNSSMYIF